MLYLIGLGLGDAKDITVKGLEIVRRASDVYLESYTSILGVGKDALEEFYNRPIKIADREFVELNAEVILNTAENSDVAFLVVGDPLGATTHTDLILRAHNRGIPYKLIHNASIINAIACCGLQLYNFGETVSVPFWTESWRPMSFFDKICSNLDRGLHTLCLLDIKIKEQSIEALMKGKILYEPTRFMSVNVAALQLLEIIKERNTNKDHNSGDSPNNLLGEESMCIGIARVGSDTQSIKSCSLKEMVNVDMGDPLHSLVIPGKVHPIESDMIKIFSN